MLSVVRKTDRRKQQYKNSNYIQKFAALCRLSLWLATGSDKSPEELTQNSLRHIVSYRPFTN